MTIRRTTAADALALWEIRLEGLKTAPEAFGSDFETDSQRPESFWVERATGSETSATFVAEDETGCFVGLAGIVTDGRKKTGHSGSIVSVYVRPEARGKGVGDGLILACLDRAREQGVARVRLAVVTTNAPAINLYLRHGFRVYGVEPDVIRVDGQSYDELLMDRTV
jgi:ribosomal protein S18 acetylase RimI-like enzyme